MLPIPTYISMKENALVRKTIFLSKIFWTLADSIRWLIFFTRLKLFFSTLNSLLTFKETYSILVSIGNKFLLIILKDILFMNMCDTVSEKWLDLKRTHWFLRILFIQLISYLQIDQLHQNYQCVNLISRFIS